MENKIRAVLLTTAGVLTAMLFWSWKHRPPEAVLVRTAAAETQDIYNSVTIFGTVESAESTAVCPAKNGVVSAVYAATGDTVQKGDILCTLTDIGRLQSAADYWQSAQSMFAISGTVNTVTAEDAHALYAPMDGTVLTVPQAGESVSVDMPCIQIANPDKLRVRAQSPELYVGELAVGQRANITFSAVDGTFHAELTAIAPAAVKTFSLTNEDAEATVEVLLPVIPRPLRCSQTIETMLRLYRMKQFASAKNKSLYSACRTAMPCSARYRPAICSRIRLKL